MSNVAIAWKFWILWVLVCIGGGIGGIILSAIIFSLLPSQSFLSIVVGLSVVGIFYGTLQYLLLKIYTRKINGIWVLASAAGIVTGCIVAGHTLAVLEKNLSWALIGAVGAVFQYLVLRQHFLRASSWILANGLSVAISKFIGTVLFNVAINATDQPPAGGYHDGPGAMLEGVSDLVWICAASVIVGLAIYGAITGGTLVWLLRHPRRK